MPIRRGAVTCSRFRIDGAVPKDTKKWITKALKTGAFEPIDPKGDEERAAGFVAFEDGALFEGMYALFSWRIEKIRLPAATIRAELNAWAQKFEDKEGRKPGRREKSEQKALLRRGLRARTPPVASVTDISLELTSREVLVWGASAKLVEEVQGALEQGLDVKLIPRVPASFVSPDVLDRLGPSKGLFDGLEAR